MNAGKIFPAEELFTHDLSNTIFINWHRQDSLL